MPIRIYALAKELGIDSKELVGACTKVGIPGKGSALASLNDDEVAKVKSFLQGSQQGGDTGGESTRTAGSPGVRDKVRRGGGLSGRGRRGGEAETGTPAPISREDYIGPTGLGGKIKVIDTRKKTSRREPTPSEQPPAEQPPVEEAPTEQPPAGPEWPRAASEEPAAETPRPGPQPEQPRASSTESPAAQEPAAQEPAAQEPAAQEPAAETPRDQTSESAKEPGVEPPRTGDQAAPTRSRPSAPSPTQDDDLLRPMKPGESDSIKIIGGPGGKRSGDKKKTGEERKPKRRAPVINVAPAPMPKAKHRAAPPKKEEPKAQEPELRLPKDAMTARKGGVPVQPPESKEAKPDKKSKKKKETKRHAPGEAAPAPEETSATSRRRGKDKKGKEPEREGSGLTGLASARADRKARRASRKTDVAPVDVAGQPAAQRPRQRRRLVRRGTNTAAPRKGKVALALPCTIRGFSEATGVGAGQIQKTLMGMGIMANINSTIDTEHVEMLAAELGLDVELKQQEKLEDSLITSILETEDDPAQLAPRPPIVTFLGHVDHGKTSILDHIIGLNVVADEEGGITQHIRAYRIDRDGRAIAFVDTPGHEAFTEMRLRGANVTDVAILVVAADDGIMPQTEEAISHAKAAGVPIVVALNKSDLPGADPSRVMTQMTEHDLTPSQWGGDVEVVQTSALTGEGLEELLETILTIADLNEYKANPNRQATGTCLEAEQEGGRGVVAKLMVKTGTLKVGDVILCGSAYGRIKAMYDTLRPKVRLDTAGPSTPVNITGIDSAPAAGELFFVLDDISQARSIAATREHQSRQESLATTTTKVSFEDFQQRLAEGRLISPESEIVTLNLIIRADVRGSIEAIQKELSKLEHPEVQVKVLQATVGAITVADVTLASASQAVIIGFNVMPDEAARSLAEERNVEIRRYGVIYKITDDIRAMLEGSLKPEQRVVDLGQAVVKQVFGISRVGAIAGCYVIRGSIQRGCRVRVNREGRTIGDYELDSLRREKEDVKEVSRGMECGIKLAGFNDVKKDDVLEAYKIEQVARTL